MVTNLYIVNARSLPAGWDPHSSSEQPQIARFSIVTGGNPTRWLRQRSLQNLAGAKKAAGSFEGGSGVKLIERDLQIWPRKK